MAHNLLVPIPLRTDIVYNKTRTNPATEAVINRLSLETGLLPDKISEIIGLAEPGNLELATIARQHGIYASKIRYILKIYRKNRKM